jgi:hypothetical protein
MMARQQAFIRHQGWAGSKEGGRGIDERKERREIIVVGGI